MYKLEETDEANEAPGTAIVSLQDLDLRLVGLCGDLDEDKAAELMYAMIALQSTSHRIDEDRNPYYEPFEFIVSSAGGSAQEKFGIYDLMRQIRETCPIRTVGLGKVFSASTLLLAAGTKGERCIGANCRVMIHSVIGGNHGSLHSLETEMDEIRWVQEQYIKALVAETDMTKRYINKLLSKKVNVYLNAEQAVEVGLADKII